MASPCRLLSPEPNLPAAHWDVAQLIGSLHGQSKSTLMTRSVVPAYQSFAKIRAVVPFEWKECKSRELCPQDSSALRLSPLKDCDIGFMPLLKREPRCFNNESQPFGHRFGVTPFMLVFALGNI